MIKTTKTLKKQNAAIMKVAEIFDDIYYDELNKEQAVVKLQYSLQLDSLFKDDKSSVSEITTQFNALLFTIFQIK